MSQAVQEAGCKRAPAAVAAPGSVWFGLMVAVWTVFFTLLTVSPETLADVYDWLTGLAIVWEILMWIVLLPWALAYVVWESSWEHWLQVLLVVLIAMVHLSVSMPRTRRHAG
jgi:hypothetical protein